MTDKQQRESLDHIKKLKDALKRADARRIKKLGQICLKVLGPDISDREVNGILRLGLDHFVREASRRAGEESYPPRPTKDRDANSVRDFILQLGGVSDMNTASMLSPTAPDWPNEAV